jgi:anti-sigma regulatory factor (Ser/Thr protein kinase)
MSQGFELSVEADLDNLKEVRKFVNESGQALGVDADTLGDLCLVVDEAVTNVILHGYEGQGGVVEVDVRGEGDAVLVHIRDRARSFEPGGVEAPELKTSLAQAAWAST